MKSNYKKGKRSIVVVLLAVIPNLLLAASTTFEAESGTLGIDWIVNTSGSPDYITITSDYAMDNPGSSDRVATYSVTFPAAGTYQLYARFRLGPNTYNDDSMFFARSFGTKSPTTPGDWFLVNGMGGFATPTDVVTGGGTPTSGVWKWINLSQKMSQDGFTVTAGNLTQTLQIAAREDGWTWTSSCSEQLATRSPSPNWTGADRPFWICRPMWSRAT